MEDKIEVADYVLLVCTELYWKKVRLRVAAGDEERAQTSAKLKEFIETLRASR